MDMANQHLTPELFVDLLEGAPVDAERTRHLASCAACRLELEELRETLGVVRSTTLSASAGRRYMTWAAAAAAVLVAMLFFHGRAPVENDEILPPIGEDLDYQLLRELSRELSDEEPLVPLLEAFEVPELTPAEEHDFLERLASDMRSTS